MCSQLAVLQASASHTDPRVRRAALGLASSLLRRCVLTLDDGRSHLLDMMIVLSVDAYSDISGVASEALDRFDTSEVSSSKLVSHAKKKLFELSKSLGSSLDFYECENLSRKLSLTRGYITFLTRDPESFFSLSNTHLNNLLQSLIIVCKMESASTSVALCEDSTKVSWDLDTFQVGPRPERNFVHLREPRNIEGLKQLCRTIGGSVCFSQVSGLLLEALRELEDVMLNETLFVFNNIITGLDTRSSCGALNEVLEYYLCLVKKRDNEELIEGVGILCQKLGDKVDLGLVMGILISNVRADSPGVLSSLHHSLVAVADDRRLTVQALIEDNLDLLYKDLNIKLRRKDCLNHYGVRMMIGMVMKASGRDQRITDLQDTIEFLLQHLAVADEEATLQILFIVQEFVKGMKQRMEVSQELGAIEHKEEDKRKGLIRKMILELEDERRKDEELADQLLTCPEEGFHEYKAKDKHDGEEEDASEPPEVKTEEQRWLETVITHCRHYISMTGQPRWQMTAIRIVSACLQLLSSSPGQAPGERQSILLPLVHLTWQPLKQCFRASNIFLMDVAFQCVMTIARVSRDFVHSRTVKDVFPGLHKFLTSVKVTSTSYRLYFMLDLLPGDVG